MKSKVWALFDKETKEVAVRHYFNIDSKLLVRLCVYENRDYARLDKQSNEYVGKLTIGVADENSLKE
jgi:hypothetical protein